jgi:hypothetical protein
MGLLVIQRNGEQVSRAKHAWRLAAVSAAVVAMSAGSVAEARPAGQNAEVYSKGNASSGLFFFYGDKFYLNDKKADGHSAVLEVAYWDPDEQGHYGTFQIWNTRGADTSRSVVHNLPEGYAVQIRACVGNASDRGNWWGCDAQDIGYA